MGTKLSEETRRRMSETRTGMERSAYIGKKISKALKGHIVTEETRKKISRANKGKTMSEEVRKKMIGRVHSNETKKKMRLSAIKNIKKSSRTGMQPNYNPEACKIIDEYGKKYGYNFQHAENGGEHHIKELGYFVDGYDKEKNVAIEYYEKAHKNQKERDKKRKQEIIDKLDCEFIELKEWELND